MCVDIIYDFASLSFDLDKQLKGQICHFVMKMDKDFEGQGQGQRSIVHRMRIAMGHDFGCEDKVARCNTLRVMGQFTVILRQNWPPGSD